MAISASQSPKLQIRRATRDDIPNILQLISDGAIDKSKRRDQSLEIANGYYEAFARMDQSKTQQLWVGEIDHIVVATCSFFLSWDLSGAGKPYGNIESVHVAPDWRSKGVGKQLLEFIMAQAAEQNCCRLQLTSDLRRQQAHRFYEKLGFKHSHAGMKLWLG